MNSKNKSTTNSSVKRTFSNTFLCKEMVPFNTLAEAMRRKNIHYLDLIPGCAWMRLEKVDDKYEGVLYIGQTISIRSQDQYDKYQAVLHKYLSPWSLEDIQSRARELTKGLFSGAHKSSLDRLPKAPSYEVAPGVGTEG